MRALLFVFGLTLFFPSFSFALSDKDYYKFMEQSPAFSEAEVTLRTAWTAFSAAASRNDYAVVVKEQREWIKKTRDAEAAKLAKSDKLPLPEAYARVATQRAKALDALTAKSLSVVNHKDIAGTYGTKDNHVTITRKGNAYAVTVATAGNRNPGEWSCEYTGEGAPQNNVFTFTDEDKSFTVTISANGSVATVEDFPRESFCGLGGSADGSYRR